MGDSACINYVNFSRAVEPDDLVASPLEQLLKGSSLLLVDLAAKREKGDPSRTPHIFLFRR
jgi:hypothetical protein